MGLWISAPDLEPGEEVVHQCAANVWTGGRSMGGRVAVTDRRVLWTPTRLDAATGGRPVTISRRDITAIRIGAGVRVQVEVDHSGDTTAFVVRDVAALSAALN